MHILETYALLSGAQIDQCFIQEEEIDLPSKKYITFHPYSPKGNSKQYDKWNEILSLLKNNSEFDYEIVQVGEVTDQRYDVNTFYLGKTSYNSLAYLIKNSQLHLGFDSFPVHLASHYDIKIVALYSYYATTCGPYFSSSDNIRIFEPDFTNTKPTFSYDDPFRLINTIDHNQVYQAIIELLGI